MGLPTLLGACAPVGPDANREWERNTKCVFGWLKRFRFSRESRESAPNSFVREGTGTETFRSFLVLVRNGDGLVSTDPIRLPLEIFLKLLQCHAIICTH